MILITKIEYEETPYNPHQLMHFKNQQGYINPEQCTEDLCAGVLSELVHGQKFTRPDGTEVTIGMSKQAAEVVGIQYKAWGVNERHIEILKEELDKSRKQVKDLQKLLEKGIASLDYADEAVKKASIWFDHVTKAPLLTRLKWLFTGVKL